ncbi:hypothetical protein SERLA73DRAFT_71899 [Serpula lacrymans var. lacrymans S7.3]|uniref:Uncharacterized protein n=1 Tax=Serpula lacrymans var. lacrymans (strain S7.3) TaxID=936435 RepID=F8PT99_SERL3|nr:hypothetical protein SERLA73DRAFT_71899 [Serpula lacrymans var. lacrymans S7.3]
MQAKLCHSPGNTVEDDICDQMSQFPQCPGRRTPSSKPSLNPSKDKEIVEKLFDDGLDDLYAKAGARNFLHFDVPPKDRCPAGVIELSDDVSEKYRIWNKLLKSHAEIYAHESSKASVFVFLVYSIVSTILDDSHAYDVPKGDVTEAGGSIWHDEPHLTGGLHAIIAENLKRRCRTLRSNRGLVIESKRTHVAIFIYETLAGGTYEFSPVSSAELMSSISSSQIAFEPLRAAGPPLRGRLPI